MIVMVDLRTALAKYREYLYCAVMNDMSDITLIETALEFISYPASTVGDNVTLGWSKELRKAGYDTASTTLHCRGMLWFINDIHQILNRVGVMYDGYRYCVLSNDSYGTMMEIRNEC